MKLEDHFFLARDGLGHANLLTLLLGIILALTGFAAVGGEPITDEDSPSLVGFNRWAHDFNQSFSADVVAPALHGVDTLPKPVSEGLGNFYHTLTEPVSALSFLMVGDVLNATRSTVRFTVNFTAGILGIFDVAEKIGLPAKKKHYSEGVCGMGLPLGSYLVVPAVGPSTVGVASSALFLMIGSTVALAYVSLEAALISTGTDIIGSAAALEGSASQKAADFSEDRHNYMIFLKKAGCDVVVD